jgi:hypothetical protein
VVRASKRICLDDLPECLANDEGLAMRLLMFLATVFCGLAASTAHATVMLMTCKDGPRTYELRFDDDQGTLVSIIDGDASQFNIRSLKSENGVITVLGSLGNRGWDFTFIYRFTPSIIYRFANGGSRTDACDVTGRRAR